jgi:hypothetical protein
MCSSTGKAGATALEGIAGSLVEGYRMLPLPTPPLPTPPLPTPPLLMPPLLMPPLLMPPLLTTPQPQ